MLRQNLREFGTRVPIGARRLAPSRTDASSQEPATCVCLFRVGRPSDSELYCLAVELGDGVLRRWLHEQRCHRVSDTGGLTQVKPALALLMANLAQTSTSSLVLDPFSGTSSLLLGAIRCGAVAFASDVSLQSPSAGTSVLSDVFAPPWRRGPWCDAIITDPPYGLREGCCTDGSASSPWRVGGSEHGLSRCYIGDWTGDELFLRVCEMLRPVFELGVRILVPGGRIIYLLPVFPSQAQLGLWNDADSTKDQRKHLEHVLPRHEAFKLLSCDRSPCRSRSMARLIVTMQKQEEQ